MPVKDGKLDGELLMDQPQGFMFQELSHHGCLLKKTLYGSALMHDFVRFLNIIFCEFKVSINISSIFVKVEWGMQGFFFLWTAYQSSLKYIFLIKLYSFLDLRLRMQKISFSHLKRAYARSLLLHFDMEEAKPMATSMEPLPER